MSFKVLASLTNKRPVKEVGNILVVATIPGTIKLSKEFALQTGLAKGDYLNIISAEVEKDGENVIRTYISKGSYAEDGDKIGSKLSEIGSSLQCSAAAAYQELGGNEDTNRIFRIIGLAEGEENEVEVLDGVTYYPIEFVRETKKVARVKKTKAEGTEEVEVEEVEEEEEDLFEEEEEVSTDNF